MILVGLFVNFRAHNDCCSIYEVFVGRLAVKTGLKNDKKEIFIPQNDCNTDLEL